MTPLVVRGGVVVDGTGAPGRRADVAIDGGIVTAIGEQVDAPPGAVEVDASGCTVAPGFVDPHTHLDAQLCWDGTGSPTNLHGVTTVVLGLCGFGVAPCPPGGGEYLLRSLEVVEEIPFAATSGAVPFEWETWPEYARYLAARPLALNAAGFVPHSALRFAAMGERARGEAASAGDRATMVGALRDALGAGAVGLATSRGPNHRDAFGEPVPSRFADDDELAALVGACRGRVWQINVETKFAGDATRLLDEIARYKAWTRAAGARLTWTPLHAEPGTDVWRAALDGAAADVVPQVSSEPITVLFRWDEPSLAAFVPGWGSAMGDWFDVGVDERIARLEDPTFRALLAAPADDLMARFAFRRGDWIIAGSPSRPDLVGGAVPDVEMLCDLLVADRLATAVQVPAVNRDVDARAELVADSRTLVGLGDSGAHVRSVSAFSYPTRILASYVRDEQRLPLEAAIHRLTAHPARFLGLPGRGVLAPGAPADVTVFDLDALTVRPLSLVHDLPGGAARLFQGATGYRAVIVNGEITLRDDEPTGASPGEVLAATDHGSQ